MPLVFEAAADAPIGCKLLDLAATGTNDNKAVVGNFRQDFPQFIDVCFCPHVNDTATNLNNLRCWNFLFGYVAAQSFYPKIRIDRPSGSRAAALKTTQ